VTVAVRMTAVPCGTVTLLAARVTVTGIRMGLTGKSAAARGDRERVPRRANASRGPKLRRCILILAVRSALPSGPDCIAVKENGALERDGAIQEEQRRFCDSSLPTPRTKTCPWGPQIQRFAQDGRFSKYTATECRDRKALWVWLPGRREGCGKRNSPEEWCRRSSRCGCRRGNGSSPGSPCGRCDWDAFPRSRS